MLILWKSGFNVNDYQTGMAYSMSGRNNLYLHITGYINA